jgi:hypothetical protein
MRRSRGGIIILIISYAPWVAGIGIIIEGMRRRKTMTMRTWLVVVMATFLLIGAAFAAEPTFGGLDRDGNGFLDEAEITGAAPEILKQYDVNGDGSLNRSEFEAAGGSPARFDLLDADKDGRIDIDEFRAAAIERFKAFDTNGDGRIDDREWTRLRKPGAAPGIVLFYF